MTTRIFHGSPRKFKSFSSQNQGKDYGPGLYFTEDFAEAIDYALASDKNGYIYEVTLTADNPFLVFDENSAKKLADDLSVKWSRVLKDKLWADPFSGYDSVDRNNYYLKLVSVLTDTYGLREAGALLHDAIKRLGWDSLYDQAKSWWVVTDASKVKILKTTKILYKDVNYSYEDYCLKQEELKRRRLERIGENDKK